ncbi:MotE family protein [Aliiroseovarius sp. 2305UL8-7]|uniref:MotE family protein n=1 Tax=Aliiroseovarius conchicola TaxID=3121637 RepID=UPI0035272117
MSRRDGKQRYRRSAAGRRVLVTIALMLGVSGVMRLGDLGIAVADDMGGLLAGTSAENEASAACTSEADIEIVLAALRGREANIAEQENQIRARLDALALADTEINEKMQALEVAERKLAATIATAETAASDDMQRLTALYENMKPKQAIPLFATMEPQFAAGFLARMNPSDAAQIMAGLDPQTAYAISVVLVGRNAQVPTN